MKNSVKKLYVSTSDKEMPRIEKEHIFLDTLGVKDDKFYAKDADRSILIASLYSYELACENGIDMPMGSLGENILTDENIYALLPGDKITIGKVHLEVAQNCTLCAGLSKVDSKLPKLLSTARGVFFKALNAEEIKIGDSITIV